MPTAKRTTTQARRRPKKGGGLGKFYFSLFLLIVGFAAGLYLAPRVYEFLPDEVKTKLHLPSGPEQAPEPKVVVKEKIVIKEKVVEKPYQTIYTVEMASFSDLESTLGLLDTFTTKGYNPYLFVKGDDSGSVADFVIRLGFFPTKGEAESFAKKLQSTEEMRGRVIKIK